MGSTSCDLAIDPGGRGRECALSGPRAASERVGRDRGSADDIGGRTLRLMTLLMTCQIAIGRSTIAKQQPHQHQ